MKKLLLLLSFAPLWANAQTNNATTEPYIDVIGTAQQEVTPNIITIFISLQEGIDKNKNKISIEDQDATMRTMLKNNNIDISKLSVAHANTQLGYTKKSTQNINRRDYQLIVNNAHDVFTTFAVLDSAQINAAKIGSTDHTEMAQFRKQIKIEALKAAKDKASYLLQAIDEQLGAPLQIKEEETKTPSQSNYYYNANQQQSNDQLELKPILVQYSISARFKILPKK